MLCALGHVIEVVDLVWKGMRHGIGDMTTTMVAVLKSLTWFGRDCDFARVGVVVARVGVLKSLTWVGRDCDTLR